MWAMSAVTRFLPRNHISFFMGYLAHLPLPRFIWTPIIRLFAKQYKINLDEAAEPVENYPSLGEFFIRKLKPGARPIGERKVLHPADSLVTQAEEIRDGKLVQAKNKFYSVVELTQDAGAFERYSSGFFVTYYLCPTDYHRVHSPVTGVIRKITHIPGDLWPVNEWSTENVDELFSINERICVEIETYQGWVNVIFVGATNVGYIELFCDSDFKGNQLTLSKPKIKESLSIEIKKGDELGCFRMGSTIVQLFSKELKSTLSPDLAEVHQLKGKRTHVCSDFLG